MSNGLCKPLDCADGYSPIYSSKANKQDYPTWLFLLASLGWRADPPLTWHSPPLVIIAALLAGGPRGGDRLGPCSPGMGRRASTECIISLLQGSACTFSAEGAGVLTQLRSLSASQRGKASELGVRGGTLVPELGQAICCHEAKVKISGQGCGGQGAPLFS